MTSKKQHIAFTGGGSGGHVQPIVSLLEYGKKQGFDASCDFFWFGEKDSQESRAAKNIDHVRFVSILSGKMRRYRTVSSTLQNIRDVFKVMGGFFQSLYLLRKYKIDTLFCKGGYVALPVSLAAKVLGIKILMHESDTHAGLVNRIVAKFADSIFTGFAGVFPGEQVVGQILSGQLGQREMAGVKEMLNIDKEKTTVLVMGGSQGAHVLFETLLHILSTHDMGNMQFFLVLGTKNQHYKTIFEKYPGVYTFDFLEQKDLAYLYALSDIALTRGSATSLAEQQLFGIKKIIVPLPFTGGNHQFYNAVRYSDLYEDIVIEQDEHMEDNILVFLEKLSKYKKSWGGIEEEVLVHAKRSIWREMETGNLMKNLKSDEEDAGKY